MPKNALPVIFLAFANANKDNKYLEFLIKEKNNIQKALQPVNREICELIVETDVTFDKLVEVFQENKNNIIVFHYAGHATFEELLLNDEKGASKKAHSEGFISFLSKQEGLDLVFLNGCFTQIQAKELRQNGIPIVIGTSESISDDTASEISAKFYQALGKGLTLKKSWNEAIDIIKTNQGNNAPRYIPAFYNEKKGNEVPWILNNEEFARKWNLPVVANSPLFGLPLPRRYYFDFPSSPYPGFKEYQENEAPIFWGRDRDIRELFNAICDIYPVVLLYGDNFVGKSSLIRAGLIPRISQYIPTSYISCQSNLDESITFRDGLIDLIAKISKLPVPLTFEESNSKDFENLSNEIDKISSNFSESFQPVLKNIVNRFWELNDSLKNKDSLRTIWYRAEKLCSENLKAKESNINKFPSMILFMDHLEENVPKLRLNASLLDFIAELENIFINAGKSTDGRLVLCIRERYLDRITSSLDQMKIPYNSFHLKPFSWSGVVDNITGIQSNPYSLSFYNCMLENRFPEFIADLLTVDNEIDYSYENDTTPEVTSPFLQLLLKEIWDERIAKSLPSMSKSLYFSIGGSFWTKKYIDACIGRDSFLQIASKNGLLYDVLFQINSEQKVHGHFYYKKITVLYQQDLNIELLIHILIENKILIENRIGTGCKIISKLLGPSIEFLYETSNLPGQIALRLLNGNDSLTRVEFESVLKGYKECRRLTEAEQEKLDVARKAFTPAIGLDLVRDNKIEDAINLLVEFYKSDVIDGDELELRSLVRDLLLISSNYYFLESNLIKGELGFEEEAYEMSRISTELIKICYRLIRIINPIINFSELDSEAFFCLKNNRIDDSIQLIKFFPVEDDLEKIQYIDKVIFQLGDLDKKIKSGLIRIEDERIQLCRIRFMLFKFIFNSSYRVISHFDKYVFPSINNSNFENWITSLQRLANERKILLLIDQLKSFSTKINYKDIETDLENFSYEQNKIERNKGLLSTNKECLLERNNYTIDQLLEIYVNLINKSNFDDLGPNNEIQDQLDLLSQMIGQCEIDQSINILSSIFAENNLEELEVNLITIKSFHNETRRIYEKGLIPTYSFGVEDFVPENRIYFEIVKLFERIREEIEYSAEKVNKLWDRYKISSTKFKLELHEKQGKQYIEHYLPFLEECLIIFKEIDMDAWSSIFLIYSELIWIKEKNEKEDPLNETINEQFIGGIRVRILDFLTRTQNKIELFNQDMNDNIENEEHFFRIFKLVEIGEIDQAISYAKFYLKLGQSQTDLINAIESRLLLINKKVSQGEFSYLAEPNELINIKFLFFRFIKELHSMEFDSVYNSKVESSFWDIQLINIRSGRIELIRKNLIGIFGERSYYLNYSEIPLCISQFNMLNKCFEIGLFKQETTEINQNRVIFCLSRAFEKFKEYENDQIFTNIDLQHNNSKDQLENHILEILRLIEFDQVKESLSYSQRNLNLNGEDSLEMDLITGQFFAIENEICQGNLTKVLEPSYLRKFKSRLYDFILMIYSKSIGLPDKNSVPSTFWQYLLDKFLEDPQNILRDEILDKLGERDFYLCYKEFPLCYSYFNMTYWKT